MTRFEEMCVLEPELRFLLNEAKAKSPGTLEVWYRDFKPRLEQLVGWGAKNKSLKSFDDYDIAYATLLNALQA